MMRCYSLSFVLASACLHATVLSLPWQAEWFEQGRTQAQGRANSASGLMQVQLLTSPSRERQEKASDQEKAPTPAETKRDQSEIVKPQAQNIDYLSPGSLTRLPSPIEPISLPAERSITAKIALTLLIDSDGFVVDVIMPGRGEKMLDDFAYKVAGRFKEARFMPGEINGKAVRSKLHITVVSEPLAPQDQTDSAPFKAPD